MHSKRVKSVMKLWQTTETRSNPEFLLEPRKNYFSELQGNLMQKQYLLGLVTWKVTRRNVWEDIATMRIKWLNNFYKFATPCMDDHQFKKENESEGELSSGCSQIDLKCLYLARIGRPGILWSVNKLARAVTKWTKSCDNHLAHLISYIHHASEYQQHCYVGNTAQQCRLGLFQLWFRRRLWRLKVNIRRGLVYFRKSHVCANKLDVQETDFSFTQSYRSWNHFSRCRFTHGRSSRSHSLGFGDWSFSFRTEQHRWTQERATGNPSAIVKSNMHNPSQ